MSAPLADVCSAWASDLDMCEPCASASGSPDYSEALMIASNLLYRLTGRQWPGFCEEEVRPCAQTHRMDNGRPIPRPQHWSGYMHPSGACACQSPASCGCCAMYAVELGSYPVVEITEVLVDGAVLDPAAYRVDDWRWLVRIDGEPWACCQDMTLDSTEEDTWQVTFTYGQAPPADGVRAAALLACEIDKACNDSGDCQLDPRVTHVVREGITMDLDTMGSFGGVSGWKTGIPFVDLFVSSANPHKIVSKAVVYNPNDYNRPLVRRVGT